jgi:UDP-N-acetylglucosamine diphosphorylase/glucosamine-1-phosphate N-acetyltransferase
MRICLVEDRGAAGLEPMSLTRPIFDLLCGPRSLADQQIRAFPGCEMGAVVRPELIDVTRFDRPGVPVNDLAWLKSGPVVLINGRWLPPLPPIDYELSRPCVGICGEEVAFVVVGPIQFTELPEDLEHFRNVLPVVDAGGEMIRHLWDLVARNSDRLVAEFAYRPPIGKPQTGASVVGLPGLIRVDPAAQIDPLVVFDSTGGPVTVAAGATVQSFSRLEGPCHVGPGCVVLGAKVRAGTTFGPNCRIGGEVECSIIQGHTNKYHDGFLGHAFVGEWVNFGAGSQASDLRNDYGPVRVMLEGRLVETGHAKVGCFVGDHAKIGLGCLLNTGTNVGPFAQLLPVGRLLPRYVPAFCATRFDGIEPRTDLDAMLDTAATVMSRRGQELTEVRAALYRSLFMATARERRRAARRPKAA